ncbi:MAG: hypothetical protein HY200_03415 [Nitrospirae bacterium]|nr:hypothetical protein [Nitrospirota bacterium]MBI3593980.1 hypothetical protein [Nitrospirota bacterium]
MIQQAFLLMTLICFAPSAYSADTATVTGNIQLHTQQNPTNRTPDTGPFGMDAHMLSNVSDPHPDTRVPLTMIGTQADTQSGRNVSSGFSEASLDQTESSSVPDFQTVINRITSSGSASARVHQLQTQIHLNQTQGTGPGAFTFDDKFSVTSVTDRSGNMVGQANGNYILTYQEVVGGVVKTTTCNGTFISQPVLDSSGKQLFDSEGRAVTQYTNTSGVTNSVTGPGCKTN